MKKIMLDENMNLVKALEADGRLFDSVEAAQKLVDFYTADDDDAEIVEIQHYVPGWMFAESEVHTWAYGVLLH